MYFILTSIINNIFTKPMEIRISKTKEDLAESFSIFFKSLVQAEKTSHVAVSGGNSPRAIFDFLAERFGDEIDWGKVNIYWVDERCVHPGNHESNYKMTHEHLLSKIDIPKDNIFRMRGEDNPEQEARRYSELLNKHLPLENEIPEFDLVILGLGDDGHTASIFPESIDLWDVDENCVVGTHPVSGQKRVTLTGKVINNAQAVAFMVTGESKAVKVREITRHQGDYKNYPASLVNPDTPDFIWFLDEDAASELD